VDLSEPAGPDPVTGERASLTEPLQDSGPDAVWAGGGVGFFDGERDGDGGTADGDGDAEGEGGASGEGAADDGAGFGVSSVTGWGEVQPPASSSRAARTAIGRRASAGTGAS
jgi:hypothetical protein